MIVTKLLYKHRIRARGVVPGVSITECDSLKPPRTLQGQLWAGRAGEKS